MFNSWIIYTCCTDAFATVINPLESMVIRHTYSVTLSTAGITGFHLYHMMFFTALTLEDILHHTVNCGLNVAIGIGCPFGRTVALSNFAMCGLPGGIDYFLLILVKLKFLAPMWEKRLNRFLNLVIRYPLQFLCSYICLLNMYLGNVNGGVFTCFCMVLALSLHYLNALYYCDKVVGNYHVKLLETNKKAE